jgi:PAS domain S-box-containing protein
LKNGKPRPVDPQLYQLVVEQTLDYAVFLLDPKGRVMTWNLGAQRIKGYAPDEIIGQHFSAFYPRDAIERDWPAQELKTATAEGRFEDEGWRVRKDGSRFWANVVITALRDDNGKLVGFSKITRDLSERKAQEEALRSSEERFRLLVEGVTDYAVFMLDPEGMVASWNAGAQRMKGYAREEIVGKHFSRFYTDDDMEAGKPWEELAIARRTGRAESERWCVRKDGERFWARAVVTALRDADGHLRGFAKVTQDLTHRHEIEQLQKAAQNVNEFIAMLAHELRNPLAPIRAALDVMAKTPPGDPRHDQLRDTIDRQAAHLSRIVEDMVDISRLTRGSLAMEKRGVTLADVVRAALETTHPAIEAARHQLELELPVERIAVEGDAHRLTQLVTNLLNNAARYTPPGGHIAVHLRADAGRALLSVRDNGRGIEPDLIGRVFDMFVQGRHPLQRVGGGLGVGLALARRIAQLPEQGNRIHPQPAARGGRGRGGAAGRRGGGAAAGGAARPGGRRQRGCRPHPGDATAIARPRDPRGARRHGRARSSAPFQARRGAARHRHAGPRWLRGGAALARDAGRAAAAHRGGHGMGHRGRPAPLAGSRLRPAPRQAAGRRRAGTGAGAQRRDTALGKVRV